MKQNSHKSKPPYLMAVVLGTALSAMGTCETAAAHEISPQTIHSLSRYCTTCWRNARLPEDVWGDCTQEVLIRLLERVPARGWQQLLRGDGDERREFLRAIDTVKKRRQRERARFHSLDGQPEVVDGRVDVLYDERETVKQVMPRVLTARQQRILEMIAQGHGVSEIAAALTTTPERVSDEKYKAIQKLRAVLL